MMGINDIPENWYFKTGLIQSENVFKNLRLVKLTKLVIGLLTIQPPPIGVDQIQISEKILQNIAEENYSAAINIIELETQNKNDDFKASYFTKLFQLINAEVKPHAADFFDKTKIFDLVKNLTGQSIPLAVNTTRLLMIKKNHPEMCKEIARQYINQPDIKNEGLLSLYLSRCLPINDDDLISYMKIFAPGLQTQDKPAIFTKNNYRSTYELVKKYNICWVVVQYPLLDINELKDYFSGEELLDPQMTFVSNKEIFETALKEKKYEDLFIDKFSRGFGHATELGNKMIADNIYPALEKVFAEGAHNCSR